MRSVAPTPSRTEAAIRRAVIDWALSHVGLTDARSELDAAHAGPIDTWEREFGLERVDWCGCFVGYALRLIGGVRDVDRRVVWMPFVLKDARSGVHGWRGLVAAEDAVLGDVVLYCWDGSGVPAHIGLVVENHRDERAIVSIEGNTTRGDDGDQARGGGVFVRERPYSVIVACVSPRYP